MAVLSNDAVYFMPTARPRAAAGRAPLAEATGITVGRSRSGLTLSALSALLLLAENKAAAGSAPRQVCRSNRCSASAD